MDKMQAQQQLKDKKFNKNRVMVAIRVRPMISKESAINQSSCIEYLPNNQIVIGKDRCFTFDNVFNQRTSQTEVYQKCVKQLVLACFQGYNAAVLAYGQTGSGKTYTMGTGSMDVQDEQDVGIIPRVIKDIFNQIQLRKETSKIIVKASFIQIYNQQIIDLLSPNNLISNNLSNLDQKNIKHSISKDILNAPTIRQQKDGSISLANVVQETVTDSEQMLSLLHKGGSNRSTSSTLMNDCSSRSHGIFAIHIEQHPIGEDQGFITAKFYFVDLAGSERAKKTGASGITFREGININLGLLELGNVISALSATERKQGQFITYRNSKLTRILQDSLGGNSNTYMISCISPAQSNYEESLNTIKYATKAMNIKNKPIINRDPHSAQINALKQRIHELQLENKAMKKALSESGITLPQEFIHRNDPRSDILSQEIKKLRMKLGQTELKNERLENELKQNSKKKNELQISNYQLKRNCDKYRLKFEKSKNLKNTTSPFMKTIIEQEFENEEQFGLIEQYQSKIRQLQSELLDQEKINNQLQQQYERLGKEMHKDQEIIMLKNKEILQLRSSLKAVKAENHRLSYEVRETSNMTLSRSQPSALIMKDIHERSIQNDMNTIQDESMSHDEYSSMDEISQLERNEEIIEAEADFRASSNVHNEKLHMMERQIREQEEKLQAMTQQQINLEYQLISQMKEQYHHKIMMLEKQKQAIIKQQEEMAGYEKNPKLKQKIETLELQLRELRKKAKDQSNLQKQVSLQNEQIKKLANEIKMHKVQKIQINRKIKQDKNAYDKFKKSKIKEILMAKKQNIKKDKEIRKLALENKRKSIQMNKKNEQLNKVKKINEAIKSYARENKKQNHKSILYSNQQKIKRSNETDDPEILIKIHQKSLDSVIAQEEIKLQMEKYDAKIKQLQAQIEKVIEEEACLQLKLDRIQIHSNYENFNRIPELKPEQQQLNAKIEELKQRTATIQQNIIFCQHRYNDLGKSLPAFYEEADVINNIHINTIQKMQAILMLTYESLRQFIANNIANYQNLSFVKAQNAELREQVEKTRQELSNSISEHQYNLGRLREEMMTKYYSNLEEQHYQPIGNNIGNYISAMNFGNSAVNLNKSNAQRMDDRQRKNYERKIIDLTKTNRQLSADVEMWRRKCSVVQQKYHNINMKMAKDKFIGRPREEEPINKKNGGGWNIGGINSINSSNTAQMLEEVNQMIDKIENRKKGLSYSEDEEVYQEKRISQNIQFSKNKWECVMTLKASRSPILSMATYNNLLVTSGTKSINIWDQQNCQLVADLSNPNYLQGFVKSVVSIPQYSYLAAACEKQVFIWDIRSYQSISILKSHKDEVRSLYSVGNLLFSAGKGGSAYGGLLVWDMRNLQSPLDEKEKNIDIFAMTSHQNTLYYGTRNHQVRRMTLEQRQVLSPFEPPHMDTVTGLAVLGSHLISGSKDKNLRLWALDGSKNNIRETTHAFNDYVNTVEQDNSIFSFYAGSRDGQVKIATVVDEKIKFTGGLIAHTQSVNSICSMGYRSAGLFLTGSSDKTVKFWKPDQQTYERLMGNCSEDY